MTVLTDEGSRHEIPLAAARAHLDAVPGAVADRRRRSRRPGLQRQPQHSQVVGRPVESAHRPRNAARSAQPDRTGRNGGAPAQPRRTAAGHLARAKARPSGLDARSARRVVRAHFALRRLRQRRFFPATPRRRGRRRRFFRRAARHRLPRAEHRPPGWQGARALHLSRPDADPAAQRRTPRVRTQLRSALAPLVPGGARRRWTDQDAAVSVLHHRRGRHDDRQPGRPFGRRHRRRHHAQDARSSAGAAARDARDANRLGQRRGPNHRPPGQCKNDPALGRARRPAGAGQPRRKRGGCARAARAAAARKPARRGAAAGAAGRRRVLARRAQRADVRRRRRAHVDHRDSRPRIDGRRLCADAPTQQSSWR